MPSEISAFVSGYQALHSLHAVAPAYQTRRRRIGGIDRKSSLQQSNGLSISIRGHSVPFREGPEEQIVGIETISRFAGCKSYLRQPQLGLDRADYTTRDLVLQLKDVFQLAIYPICQHMSAVCRID
jgi:hypothetical protein